MRWLYEDILYFPHHVSKTRRRMSNFERAAQFSSFAALNGYEDGVAERARLTTEKIVLDEDQVRFLNDELSQILEKSAEQPLVEICFFEEDPQKDGGKYIYKIGNFRTIDEEKNEVILTDRTSILIENMLYIKRKL